MANSLQARKRARQNIKRRAQNMSQRSAMRTSIKKLLKLIQSGGKDAAELAYRDSVVKIDSATSKRIHHRNRAARLKSRLNNRLRGLNI